VSRVEERPPGAVRIEDDLYSIPVTSVSLPHRLVISDVSFSPDPLTPRVESIVAQFVVTDTRRFRVRSAAVFIRGLRYGQFASAKRGKTDRAGIARITLTPTEQVVFHRGGRVAIFIRASKPGEPTLEGVSVRRLVQFRLAP